MALVTGGSRGIGAAIAQVLADDGYQVCFTYRADAASAEHVLARLEATGTKAIAVQSDVSVEDDVVSLFQRIDHTFGRIDALVNNAGILRPQTRVEHLEASRIAEIFATNVIGSFLCCREAVRRMSTAHGGEGGAIVNMSSAAARLGGPGEYVDYAASKGAIDTLTTGLATEVANEGIRVNGIRPGLIHTDMHAAGGEPDRIDRLSGVIPMRRGGQPDEVAQAALWLLSPEASYVTGSTMDVSGGR